MKHGKQKRAPIINIENYAPAPKMAKVEKETNFPCPQCPAEFTEKRNLIRHVGSVHGDKKIKCGLCEKTFGLEQHLGRHMQAVHLENTYKCDFCDFTCSRKDNLTRHKTMKHGIQKRAPTINIEDYAPAPKMAKVEKETNFPCPQCPAEFTEKQNLIRHVGSVHGDKKIKCGLCEKTFGLEQHLGRHMQAVHLENKYKCDLCDFSCSRKDNLTRHRIVKHAIQKRAPSINIENYAPEPKAAKVEKNTNFTCPQCPAEFKERKILNRHIDSVY